jgi:aldehyde dehydrogenase (NAD+)
MTAPFSLAAPRALFDAQQAARSRIAKRTALERRAKLLALREAIQIRRSKLAEALECDFGKSAAEVELSEIFTTLTELNYAIKNVARWMRPKKVWAPLALIGTSGEVRREPKGVVLIIGAWNYPFSLVIVPLLSAVAAGNCAILKPSELCPATSAVIRELVASVFEPDEVTVVEGGTEVTQELLGLRFDHIFFTGSTRIGTLVAQGAARNLIPVTLELGGKSPAILDETADLASAAERIAWGKFLNAGQTCVAPDYVLVPKSSYASFLKVLCAATTRMFPGPRSTCKIVTAGHYERLKTLLSAEVAQGSTIELGGSCEDEERRICPTILSGSSFASPLMKEEIFGPILPVIPYEEWEPVSQYLQSQPKALALYVFSHSESFVEKVLAQVPSGGCCINNTVVHLLNPRLPFGGVGQSGTGNYHGEYGFRTFSHERTVVRQRWGNALKPLYPPYSHRVRTLISLATRFLTR